MRPAIVRSGRAEICCNAIVVSAAIWDKQVLESILSALSPYLPALSQKLYETIEIAGLEGFQPMFKVDYQCLISRIGPAC
jgi:hypothetical protein